MKQRKIQYSLIPAQGADELVFDFYESEQLGDNLKAIDESYLKEFASLDSMRSFRLILDKSQDYLAKIIENSSYKKLLSQTLEVAKSDLNFSNKNNKTLTLEQKIKNQNKMSGPKPKI